MRGRIIGGGSPITRPGFPAGGDKAVASYRAVVASAPSTSDQSGAFTLTAPVAGVYRLALRGPGGSGGCLYAQRSANALQASGGGSGGAVLSEQFLMAAGQTIGVNIGAGGDGASVPVNSSKYGNPGKAATTATLPNGKVLSAGPGQGGMTSLVAWTTFRPLPGAGGTASGGEINQVGNVGGEARVAGVNGAGSIIPPGTDNITILGTQITNNSGATGVSGVGIAGAAGGSAPTLFGTLPHQIGGYGVTNYSSAYSRSPSFGVGGGGQALDSDSMGNGAAPVSAPGSCGAAYLILEYPIPADGRTAP